MSVGHNGEWEQACRHFLITNPSEVPGTARESRGKEGGHLGDRMSNLKLTGAAGCIAGRWFLQGYQKDLLPCSSSEVEPMFKVLLLKLQLSVVLSAVGPCPVLFRVWFSVTCFCSLL
jgi:hypothetical protein